MITLPLLLDLGISVSFQNGQLTGTISVWWFVIIFAMLLLWHMLTGRRGGVH